MSDVVIFGIGVLVGALGLLGGMVRLAEPVSEPDVKLPGGVNTHHRSWYEVTEDGWWFDEGDRFHFVGSRSITGFYSEKHGWIVTNTRSFFGCENGFNGDVETFQGENYRVVCSNGEISVYNELNPEREDDVEFRGIEVDDGDE